LQLASLSHKKETEKQRSLNLFLYFCFTLPFALTPQNQKRAGKANNRDKTKRNSLFEKELRNFIFTHLLTTTTPPPTIIF
jgi:hypothetical protein